MLFRRKSKDSLSRKDSSASIKKSRSARDLLSKLTSTPSQSKKSSENKNEFEIIRPKLDLPLNLNQPYSLHQEPFTVLTPRDDEFQNQDLMTPIRQMTATPEISQAPPPPQQLQSSQTQPQSHQRVKALSTIIDFENESIVEMYTPRKPVHIQNSIRLDSACAILEKISLGDDRETFPEYGVIKPENVNDDKEEAAINQNNSTFEADDGDLTFDGVFSTSTSCRNSPSKDPFDSVSLTETNIQIYKRMHRKSKHSSLHFLQNPIESPTKPQRPQVASIPLQAGLGEEHDDAKDVELYQLEIMLVQEKHKYEMKQQQRAMDHLQSQLEQQRAENTHLRNKLAQVGNDARLLPAFKWKEPAKNKEANHHHQHHHHKVTFKDDDAGSLVSSEESIMSLYYDERKVSGASTVSSSTNSINKVI
ncbi:hypothetical protein CANMA_000430 [Candida margitis]|uniref:uncharacterized protein n=1 Tax=Candida margitis TaxID=1775924 RepID=UPI0022278D9B|nr:uncharacterized protein CANMA_000430 [Candida margitis]KAI5970521.1 hypothetical protein CANMA_000430 [Candida margitis]